MDVADNKMNPLGRASDNVTLVAVVVLMFETVIVWNNLSPADIAPTEAVRDTTRLDVSTVVVAVPVLFDVFGS